jgi:hypothetical protein
MAGRWLWGIDGYSLGQRELLASGYRVWLWRSFVKRRELRIGTKLCSESLLPNLISEAGAVVEETAISFQPNHGFQQQSEGAVFQFNRGISQAFVDRLNAEYDDENRGGWWRSIALDRDLFIAIRNKYINVYWNGSSLLRLSLVGGRLVGEIHYKYLLRGSMPKPYIKVHDGVIELDNSSALFQTGQFDVAAIKKAASAYLSDEKKGVHQILLSNDNIIDVEIAFGTGEKEE